jgi:NADPH:quinone reductase
VLEVPDPPPLGPGQVKIRVHAATVNPTDTYMRNGSYRRLLGGSQPPYIPGIDTAGRRSWSCVLSATGPR